MDIRNWPLDKIMQLPDWCFGRRWPVITSDRIDPLTMAQWLVKGSLPDAVVLWQLIMYIGMSEPYNARVKISLGGFDPANAAEFDAFRQLFPGDYDNVLDPRAISLSVGALTSLSMRFPIETQGESFIIQIENIHGTLNLYFTGIFIVSAVPKEVPDWLVSGSVKNL